ncbi:MAG TPA: hypothetical protein VF159_10415 [Gemmatimonadaceae bacterium]
MLVELSFGTAVVAGSLLLMFMTVRRGGAGVGRRAAAGMSTFLLGLTILVDVWIPMGTLASVTELVFLATATWLAFTEWRLGSRAGFGSR